MSDFLTRTYQIGRAYNEVLGRDPDPNGLRHYLRGSEPITAVREQLLKSEEGRRVTAALALASERIRDLARGRPALLLFGAYGNGNAGDAIQPSLILSAIQKRSDAAVFAFSQLDVAPYSFPADYVLRKDHLPLHPTTLRQFDALIVGGGGLFAHPHDPLWSDIWADVVPIPFSILGCGVAPILPTGCRRLFSRATFVSVRDVASQRAVARVTKHVHLCPDPFLGHATMRAACSTSRRYRTAYVVRGPLSSIHQALSAAVGTDDIVLSMEPAIDSPLKSEFSGMLDTPSMEDLVDVLSRCERIVTQRYHGAIAAIKLGKPVAALTTGDNNESKLIELFEQIGLLNWCKRSFTFPPWESFAYPDLNGFLTTSTQRFDESISGLLRSHHLATRPS